MTLRRGRRITAAAAEAGVYRPYAGRITERREETPEITTLRIVFTDPDVAAAFTFKPGNFVLASVLGDGEAPFAIASPPSHRGAIEISVRRLGRLTQALHERIVGDRVGVRGPYGNDFLQQELRGKNLVFVAGGIGMAPLRSLVYHVLEDRPSYGAVTILFGARTVADIPYQDEFAKWRRVAGVDVVLTVDPGGETPDWAGRIGYVPTVLRELQIAPDNGVAFVCGPQIVITQAAQTLAAWGFADTAILSTLENRMKCGIGKCGRCNIGHRYVCKHGPVFTYAEIKTMPLSDY